jgi:GT2 family glycosyltransferase
MKISIIIVNYQVRKELLSCIDSILKNPPKTPYEIIIVDNDENSTLDKYLRLKFPRVKYIKSTRNLGYGAGNNLGAKKAQGEYIFILNPDTKIIKGNINKLIEFSEKNKKTGAVSPQLLDRRHNVYDEQGALELTPFRAVIVLSFINKLFPKNRVSKKYWGIPWDKSKLKEVDVVPGTAFIIKKSIFEKIGGFDENFFLFFEEFDLCRRLIQKGFKNYISPELKIYHKWGASTKKNPNTIKYFLKSRFYYFKKNYGLMNAVIVSFILAINKKNTFTFLILIVILYGLLT